jgi:hypothetical protein
MEEMHKKIDSQLQDLLNESPLQPHTEERTKGVLWGTPLRWFFDVATVSDVQTTKAEYFNNSMYINIGLEII